MAALFLLCVVAALNIALAQHNLTRCGGNWEISRFTAEEYSATVNGTNYSLKDGKLFVNETFKRQANARDVKQFREYCEDQEELDSEFSKPISLQMASSSSSRRRSVEQSTRCRSSLKIQIATGSYQQLPVSMRESECGENATNFSKPGGHNVKVTQEASTANAENSGAPEKPKIFRTEKIFQISEPSNSNLREEAAEETINNKSVQVGKSNEYSRVSESMYREKSQEAVGEAESVQVREKFHEHEAPQRARKIVGRPFPHKIPLEVYRMSVNIGSTDTGANVRRIVEKLEKAQLGNLLERQVKSQRSSPVRTGKERQAEMQRTDAPKLPQ